MGQKETTRCTQREYVKAELLAYLELETPGFAVLLRGPWGCGKTYLIKEIKKELERKGKEVRYVSLNGASSREVIDERLAMAFLNESETKKAKAIRALKGVLPIVGNVGNRVLKDLCRGVSTLINGLANKKTAIGSIVFDDLERCLMPLPDLLGYLEELVTTFQVPVVYIGNEEKIREKDGKDGVEPIYHKIKERFIQQSYTLHSEPSEILPQLINATYSELKRGKDFCVFCCWLVDSLRGLTKEENYRAFKSALYQYVRFSARPEINDVLTKNADLQFHFACLFLALAYPAQFGLMQKEDCWQPLYLRAQQDQDELPPYDFEQAVEVCSECYRTRLGIAIEDEPLLDVDVWQAIIKHEVIDVKAISEALQKTHYFQTPPVWEPLFRFRFKDDQTTKNAKKSVVKALRNREIVDAQEIRMLFGLMEGYAKTRAEARRLRFNLSPEDSHKFWKRWQDAIYHRFQRYVDTLLNANLLDLTSMNGSDVYLGHELPGASNPTETLYENMRNYLLKIYEEHNIKQTNKRLHTYLTEQDLNGLSDFLLEESVSTRPILCLDTSGVEAFFQTMTHADMNALLKFNDCLHKRYYIRYSNRQEHLQMFQEEQETWQRLSATFEKRKTDIYKEHACEPLWIITLDRLIEMIHNKLIITQSPTNSEAK